MPNPYEESRHDPAKIESIFEEGALVEEDVILFRDPDEQPDEIDIAFQSNDEEYW